MLYRTLPAREPVPGLNYMRVLGSMWRIYARTEILRRRALYHACMFGAFSVFWTAAPLWLTGPQFGLTQKGVAWVALAGVAGAVAPPIAGRVADRGWSKRGTTIAMMLAVIAFVISDLAHGRSRIALSLVVACAVILDFAVSANLVFGQRAVYSLSVEERSRIRALFMATFFVGGAVSSALSGWIYYQFGWTGVSVLEITLPIAALIYLGTERHTKRGAEHMGAVSRVEES